MATGLEAKARTRQLYEDGCAPGTSIATGGYTLSVFTTENKGTFLEAWNHSDTLCFSRNIERHANAECVKAALRHVGNGQLALSIEDDGAGFDTGADNAGHFGLVGMREQAHLIGAELTIRSEPRKGTLLYLEFGAGFDAA